MFIKSNGNSNFLNFNLIFMMLRRLKKISVTTYHATWCQTISGNITKSHIIPHQVIWRDAMIHHIRHHITLHHVMSSHPVCHRVLHLMPSCQVTSNYVLLHCSISCHVNSPPLCWNVKWEIQKIYKKSRTRVFWLPLTVIYCNVLCYQTSRLSVT